MTRAVLALGDRMMLRHRCGRCLVLSGEWCVTARGGRAASLHAARFDAAQAANDLPLTDADLAALS